MTLLEADTRTPVFHARVSAAEFGLPPARLVSGRTYQVNIVALAEDGEFLGATPGAGAAPWVVTAL